MVKNILVLFCVVLLGLNVVAQNPTWEKQISCILFSHCTTCHNSNGLAPFPLSTYSQAYSNRFGILNDVVSRKMPPYLPDVSYSHFSDERVLTNDEIDLITKWVNAGAPAGDTTNALPPPVYTSVNGIPSPDFLASIPVFKVPNTGADLYQAFVISNPSSSARYITDVEIIPGNRSIVHHVLIYQDTSITPVIKDSASAGPGYVSFSGIGSNTGKMISAWAPGTGVFSLPAGMGIKLDSGARIILQIHYPVNAIGQIDSTKVSFKFGTNIPRIVNGGSFLSNTNMTNGPLFIPADSVKTFHSQYTVPINASILSLAPHAHLLGKKFLVYGITPTNDTIHLIKIDNWDYHWQGFHTFQKPIKIPIGTVLHGYVFYDNTINNPENPNSPPKDVSLGEATADEMLLVYFEFLPYQNGDENIIIDTTSHPAHYQQCVPAPLTTGVSTTTLNSSNISIFPNPTSSYLTISNGINYSFEIVNTLGELVLTAQHTNSIDVSTLSNGVYFLKSTQNQTSIIKKVIIFRD